MSEVLPTYPSRALFTEEEAIACAIASIQTGDQEDPFGIANLELDPNHCNKETYVCDMSHLKAYVESNCDGGKVITETLLYCKEDLNDPTITQNIKMKDFPVCVATSCPSDTTFTGIMIAFDKILKEMGQGIDFPKSLLGEKCDTTNSNAAEVKMWLLYLVAAVAGVAAHLYV